MDETTHSACVNAWLERVAAGLPSPRLVEAFQHAFDAVWRRAHQTLGEVTLNAILDRVLYNTVERHPILAPLRLDADGLQWQELRDRAGGMAEEQLTDAIRFVLVEFLTVLGNLTAEILTPSLHAALSSLAPSELDRDEKMSQRERQVPPRPDGEDAK